MFAAMPLAAVAQDDPRYQEIEIGQLIEAPVALDRCITLEGDEREQDIGGLLFLIQFHTDDPEWSFRRYTWQEINQGHENFSERAEEFRGQFILYVGDALGNIAPFVYIENDDINYYISHCLRQGFIGGDSRSFSNVLVDGPDFYPAVFVRPENVSVSSVMEEFRDQSEIVVLESRSSEVAANGGEVSIRTLIDDLLRAAIEDNAQGSGDDEVSLPLRLQELDPALEGTTVTIWWEADGGEPPEDAFVAQLVPADALSSDPAEEGGGSGSEDAASAVQEDSTADTTSAATDGDRNDADEADPANGTGSEDPAAGDDHGVQAAVTSEGPDGSDAAASGAAETATLADDTGASTGAEAELPADGEVAEETPATLPSPPAIPVAIQVPDLLAEVDLSGSLRVVGCDGDVRRDGAEYFQPCASDGPYRLVIDPFEPIELPGRISVLTVEDFQVAEATFAGATGGVGGRYGLEALAAPDGVRLPQDFSEWPGLGESGRVAEACYRTVRLEIASLPSGTALPVEPGCTVVPIDRSLADIPVATDCLNAADWQGAQCVLPHGQTQPRVFVEGLGGQGTVTPMRLDAWLALDPDPRPAWPYPGSPIDDGYTVESLQYCTGGGGCCGPDRVDAFELTATGAAVMPPVSAGTCQGPVDTVQVAFAPIEGDDGPLVDGWTLTDGASGAQRPFPWTAADDGAVGLAPDLAATVAPRVRAATWSGGGFRSSDRIVLNGGSTVCPSDPSGTDATVESLGLDGLRRVDLQPPVAARISDGERFLSDCLTGRLSLTVDFDLAGQEVAPAGGLVVFLTRSERLQEAGVAGAIVAALVGFATASEDGRPPVPLTLIVDNGDGVPDTVLSPVDLEVEDPAAEVRRRLGDLQFNAALAPPIRGLRESAAEIEAIGPQALVVITSDEIEGFEPTEVHTLDAWRFRYGWDLFVAGRVDCATWQIEADLPGDRCVAVPERVDTQEGREAVRDRLAAMLNRAAGQPVRTTEAVD
jgi:hypothetical protein